LHNFSRTKLGYHVWSAYVLITALVVDRLQPIWLTDWLGVMAAARVERERGGVGLGLAHARARDKSFPSNSCFD